MIPGEQVPGCLLQRLVTFLEQLVEQFDGAVQIAVIDAGLGLFEFAGAARLGRLKIHQFDSAVQAPATGRDR